MSDLLKFNLLYYIDNFNYNEVSIIDNHTKSHSVIMTNYLSKSKIDIIFKSVDDILNTPAENFYFILPKPWMGYDDISKMFNEKNEFSKTFIPLLKLNNFKFIIIDEHEVDSAEDISVFVHTLDNLKLNTQNVHIINNDSRIGEYKILNNWKINVDKINYLGWLSCLNFSKIDIEFNSEIHDYIFLCKNKEGKTHRIAILAFLDRLNLLNAANHSLLIPDRFTDITTYSDFFDDDLESTKSFIQKYINITPYSTKWDTNVPQLMKRVDNGDIGWTLNIRDYLESYINIVTESEFLRNVIHISEKSFKPFAFYQLPIIIATPHHVRTLRDEYGFDMFDDIINHSYDLEMDNNKRFMMIVEEIGRLNNNKDFIHQFYKNNKNRFESNRDIIQKIAIESTDENIFQSILIKNII